MSNFYENQKSFTNYQDLMNPLNYQKVPEDWIVVISDIKGSTEAVKQGRYRAVNMVGSMPIAAILNKLDQTIPFVFGGDGATLLIPPCFEKEVIEEMQRCIYLSKSRYNLELRAGLVPVRDLKIPLEVAKYELSQGNFVAQFRGGGIEVAEKLVKSPTSPYLLKEEAGYPSLDGLTCRWAPLKSGRGKMLTLIIKSEDKNYAIFESILKEITTITKRELKDSSPVAVNRLTASWPPPISLETNAIVKDQPYLKTYIKTLITNFIVYLFVKLNLNNKNFSMEKYKKEISTNSDFKKFDDVLRLVLDCSKTEVSTILKFLNDLESLGIISYGSFLSKKAVMTCLVFSTDQDHIHFIDGSEGGYTNAAASLKLKLLEKKPIKKST